MQQTIKYERSNGLKSLPIKIVAIIGTVILVIAVTFSFARKPAERVCRGRSDDWLRSSLQFYFENTSTDDNKDFKILPGSTWDNLTQSWKVVFTHDGKPYSALVTCKGDVKLLNTSRHRSRPSFLHPIIEDALAIA